MTLPQQRFAALEIDEKTRAMRFDVAGVDLCIINAVRRTIMADVPVAAFRFDPTHPDHATDDGVRVLRNTSSLHNEFVGHRISMVPVCLDENQLHGFDPARYNCVLKVKNAGSDVRNVTTADFDVFDQAGVKLSKAVRDGLFPPCPIAGDHILLLRLKPSSVCDGNGEEILAECTASVGTGRQHARWSPVSKCFFRNKIDEGASEKNLAEKLEGVEDEADRATITAQHATLDAHRCFVKDQHGDPAAFEFFVQSECRLRPSFLVFSALQVLCARLTTMADALVTHDEERVSIQPVANMDDFFHMTLRDEDHTMGNLLQGMLYKRWVRDEGGATVTFVGYSQPHPLENHIVFKIKCAKPGDDVRPHVQEGARWIVSLLEDLLVEWVRFSGLDKQGVVAVDEFLIRNGRRRASAAAALLKKSG